MASSQSSSEDRAKGCFWGQLIGDALGSTYEFQESKHVKARIEKALDGNRQLRMLGGGPFGLAVGQVTDDSEMALSLAGTLIRDGTYKQESIACAYSRWMRTSPPDIGRTTRAALLSTHCVYTRNCLDRRLTEAWWTTMSQKDITDVLETVIARVRVHNKESQSNGCLMRISPLAVAYWNSPEKLLHIGELDVALTHLHENCFDAIRVYLTAASALIRGTTPTEAFDEAVNAARTEMVKLHLEDSQRFAVPVRLSNGNTSNGDNRAIGYIGVALQVAFHEMLTCSNFSEGLINSIKIGGDTDTNAAITGAVVKWGARFGEAAIPEDWIRDVRNAPLRLQGENSIDTVDSILYGLLQFNRI